MNRRRRTTPTPNVDTSPTTDKENTMPDTEPTLTTEEQDATEQLARIPADFVTDDLRADVLRAARAAALRQEVADATTAAHTAVQTAIVTGAVAEALAAAGTLAALDRIAEYLPSVDLDAVVVDNAFTVAGRFLREAEATLIPLPIVSYSSEVTAWRELPPLVQVTTPHPLVTPADIAAEAAVDALAAQREAVLAGVTSWHRASGRVELITHLAAAGGHVEACRQHVEECARAATVVDGANATRAEAGLTWSAPQGVSTSAAAPSK